MKGYIALTKITPINITRTSAKTADKVNRRYQDFKNLLFIISEFDKIIPMISTMRIAVNIGK
jgi:hypothetical protein